MAAPAVLNQARVWVGRLSGREKKIGLLVLAAGVVYLYAAAVYQPIERGRVRATAELSQAKVEMEGLSAALAAARSELARIKAGGKPTPSAAPVLLHPRDGAGVVLDEILRLRDAAGVEVRGLVPSAMVDKGTYNDLAVKVSVRGRTSDVVRYLALLEAHEPVLDVRRLKMETTPASLPDVVSELEVGAFVGK
ncbi:MAG: GspMb/PilO family protein [Nitrospirota bacterium]